MGDFLDLAKTRRSVRTFDGKSINSNIIEELEKYSKEIKNPYGIPVRFVFLDAKENNLSSPVLTGENLYVTAIVMPGVHADEAYGYSFEALLMKAHELGLGTVWIGGTMPREKFEKASRLTDGEVMPCVSPLGNIAESMSMKEGLMRKGVKADKRYEFEKLFYYGNFENPISESKAEELGLLRAFEAVRIAPSAVNKQPWRIVVEDNEAHFYIKHDRGYDNGTYDLQKIDMGIGMYHFERQIVSEGKNLSLEINAPELATAKDIEYIASYRIL